MSDFGDDMREWRDRKRRARTEMEECHCNYGGNYRKISPLGKCHICGFEGSRFDAKTGVK